MYGDLGGSSKRRGATSFLLCSISTVYKARCTLTKTEVIIKQYIKAKMSHRALHKMQREASQHTTTSALLAQGVAAALLQRAQDCLCLHIFVGNLELKPKCKSPLQIRLMYMLRRQPGVAQILGDFEDEHYYYIIMEYCAGGPLICF